MRSGVFFFLKSLTAGGLIFMVSFSASIAEVGILGVLMRVANIAGLGLVLLSPKYAVDIANASSYDFIGRELDKVRKMSLTLPFCASRA